jgi:hypothetical protein
LTEPLCGRTLAPFLTGRRRATMNVNWERLWRMNGVNFAVFFIIAYIV